MNESIFEYVVARVNLPKADVLHIMTEARLHGWTKEKALAEAKDLYKKMRSAMTMTAETYKGYGIDFNLYGDNEYSVQYCGDDLIFGTLEEAETFIDEIVEFWSNTKITYNGKEL